MDKGFCPYCAHQNPSDYTFCVACKKKLPEVETVAPPSTKGTGASSPDGTEPDAAEAGEGGEAEPAPPRSARWVVPVLVIAVAAVVVVAGVVTLTNLLPFHTGSGNPPPVPVTAVSECQKSTALNCAGSQIQLPRSQPGGLTINTTACDPLMSAGQGDELWFNFTTNSGVYGVLIPVSLYGGNATNFGIDPAGFFNNNTAVSEAAWNSGPADGAFHVVADVPATTSAWCLAWWDPGAPATISLNSNVVLLEPTSSVT